MADVTLRGNPITLGGSEVKAGQNAPDFTASTTGQSRQAQRCEGQVVS